MKLSPHFTFEEATYSETAIRNNISNNHVSTDIMRAMQISAANLEVLRKEIGPIQITSWYRCPELNKMVGGAKNSVHMTGWAIDCKSSKIPVYDLCVFASEVLENYDQIIHEFGSWMHISFDPKNRKETLTIFSKGIYKEGILTKQEYLQS